MVTHEVRTEGPTATGAYRAVCACGWATRLRAYPEIVEHAGEEHVAAVLHEAEGIGSAATMR